MRSEKAASSAKMLDIPKTRTGTDSWSSAFNERRDRWLRHRLHRLLLRPVLRTPWNLDKQSLTRRILTISHDIEMQVNSLSRNAIKHRQSYCSSPRCLSRQTNKNFAVEKFKKSKSMFIPQRHPCQSSSSSSRPRARPPRLCRSAPRPRPALARRPSASSCAPWRPSSRRRRISAFWALQEKVLAWQAKESENVNR